ncbi:AraC family transcriptional regulator, partial [Pseudoalteromonas carrageenovora]
LKELINSYRVEYAKELLRNGKCLMKDIPKRCGFASKSAFYSAFKKMTGYRPVEYIRRNGVEEKFGENN